MPLRSLLTVIRSEAEAPLQIGSAAAIARTHDAHLDILCLGIDEIQVGYYFAGADTVLQQTSMAMAKEKADALLAKAESLAGAEDVRWSARALVSQIGVLSEVVAQDARFADLVLLPPPYGEAANTENEAVLEAALFTAAAPVLVVPENGLPQGFARCAVIGWNEGSEALRAVRGALPFLQKADSAVVTIVDPPRHAADRADPGERLSTMLARHGVKAEIDLLAKTQPRVADMLARQAADRGADLLVAGAYGHSRFREALLGGATRDLLHAAKVPLLMAH
jgi:nucleotide-binding universal stress UspA family protein